MPDEKTNPTRGRPKTLDREHVLQIALTGYWVEGPTNLSIGEICQKAGVSKPGLYREFGSDDGLKAAALELYYQKALIPLYEILASDDSFENVIDNFVEFVAQDRQALGIPDGCLQVEMRACRGELGAMTGAKVDELREKTLERYKNLIERSKSRGEFKTDISTDVAVLYFDAQNGGAMRMQKEGVPPDLIKEALRFAFLPFR